MGTIASSKQETPEVDTDLTSLSKRGQYAYSDDEKLFAYLGKTLQNAYHPDDNPEGIVNMGSAVNKLMEKEMQERLSASDVFTFTSSEHQHYFAMHGKPTLRLAIANFIKKYFNAAEDISPDHIIVMAGGASCLDSLSFALFDPGDVYITPTPTYGRIFANFNQRSLAQPHALELPEEPDSEGKRFNLTPELLEKRILELRLEGTIPKGFVLINPQNPLGDVYSPRLLRGLLEVCAKYEMHVVIDEVYALSLLNTEAEVVSVLSIPGLPDPQRTHIVWGFSKDMGLAGFRVGVIHTKNLALLELLKKLAIFCPSASIIQEAARVILSDEEWLDQVLFPRQRQRLQERYLMTKTRFEALGIYMRPAEAGLFVWIDLKRYLRSPTKESELELFEKIFQAGVYVVPGAWMRCNNPGWFRVTISVRPEELQRGLSQLEAVLEGMKSSL